MLDPLTCLLLAAAVAGACHVVRRLTRNRPDQDAVEEFFQRLEQLGFVPVGQVDPQSCSIWSRRLPAPWYAGDLLVTFFWPPPNADMPCQACGQHGQFTVYEAVPSGDGSVRSYVFETVGTKCAGCAKFFRDGRARGCLASMLDDGFSFEDVLDAIERVDIACMSDLPYGIVGPEYLFTRAHAELRRGRRHFFAAFRAVGIEPTDEIYR